MPDAGIHTSSERVDTFKVAFYNVENLFDLQFDGQEYPEYKPGTSNWDRDMYRKKLENIASVLESLQADVIGFCEIEDGDALKDLQGALQKRGCRYSFHMIDNETCRSNTRPAVLSKFPLKDMKVIDVNLPGNARTRHILETDVHIGTYKLKIFVNHWPSKNHPESHRLEAARTLALRLETITPGTDYIIIGDLNSNYDEYATVRSNRLDDTEGETGINHILQTAEIRNGRIRVSRLFSEQEIQISRAKTHYNLWLEIPESKRMSHVYRGSNQTPDNILLPPALYDLAGISYLDNSFEVHTMDGKLLHRGVPFRWQMRWGKGKRKYHVGEGYSDHLPISARFVTGPFRFDTSGQPTFQSQKGDFVHDSQTRVQRQPEMMSGWVVCKAGVIMTRDTLQGTGQCLKISGDSFKNNFSAIRTVLDNPERKSKLILHLKGTGKLSFRVRTGDGAWSYYNAPSFAFSNNARYAPVDLPRWKRVVLNLQDSKPELEIELRIGKELPYCFWISSIGFK